MINLPSSTDYISIPDGTVLLYPEFLWKNETCEDLKCSFEKNVIKDMGENSKEEFDFEYDKSTNTEK